MGLAFIAAALVSRSGATRHRRARRSCASSSATSTSASSTGGSPRAPWSSASRTTVPTSTSSSSSTHDAGLPLRPDGITLDEDALEKRIAGSIEPALGGQDERPSGPTEARPLRARLQHVRPLHGRHARRLGRPMTRPPREFRPFAPRARSDDRRDRRHVRARSSARAPSISIWSTGKSRNRAAVVEIAGRQRTLAERYVTQLLLVREGAQASPQRTGVLLTAERQCAPERRHRAGRRGRRRRARCCKPKPIRGSGRRSSSSRS